MSEFSNPNDPLRRDSPYDLNARQGGVGTWIAGAVLVIVLVALAVGINHAPNRAGANMTANNTSALNQPAPKPTGPASRAFTPTPMNPSGLGAAPTTPAKP